MQKSYVTPWTLKVYEALPGTPLCIGICLATILMVMFLVSRTFFLGEIAPSSGDFRMAVIHILLSAYLASAYVYLLQAAKKSVAELEPVIRIHSDLRYVTDRTGTHLWWGLAAAGLTGILVGVYATNVTTIGSDPWDWQQIGFDTRWMRVLGPIIGWLNGCMLYVLALFLFEPGFRLLMIQLFSVIAIFAWIGLMLPIRGIRIKIKVAKKKELDWCRRTLKLARDELKTGTDGRQTISEILSYKSMLEDIRNWPFDSPSITRFALYLLIPVGSMFGGAFVERGLDFFFP